MRGLLAIFCCMLCAGAAHADDAALLLSDHTALVPPDAPTTLIEHLVQHHHALIYQPASSDSPVPDNLKPWVISLPELPLIRQTAAQMIAAWVTEYEIDIAVLPGSSGSARDWRTALEGSCDLFETADKFEPGAIAIPDGDRYLLYRGPRPVFFQADPPAMVVLLDRHLADDTALTAAEEELARQASALQVVATDNPEFGDILLQALARTIITADSVADVDTAIMPLSHEYSRRWRSILSDRIAPDIAVTEFTGPAGTGSEGKLSVISNAPVAIQVDSIATSGSALQITWITPLPEVLAPGGQLTLEGRGVSQSLGRQQVNGLLCYDYMGIDCIRPVTIRADISASLDVEFDPPILYASDAIERPDPDYRVKAVPVTARLANRTPGTRQLTLTWYADDPVSLSTPPREITLNAGEVRSIPITLSVPLGWKGRALDYGVKIEEAGHLAATGEGHLWQQPAELDGKPQVAIIGDAAVWLAALNAAHISAFPMAIEYLTAADLTPFRVVIIAENAPAPAPGMREAIQDLARRGRRILIDLTPASAAWLPWPAELDYRPAPLAAKFFREGHEWWTAPNRLIGDCYAAVTPGSTYTLPAGVADWEPLVTDLGGKGFMYRRAEGTGWYVVIHDGWKSGLRTMERLPMMGLINLVGKAIR